MSREQALRLAYADGFAGALEKSAVLVSDTVFRDHVADAETADTGYPLYVRDREIVDGAHRLARLIADRKREAGVVDVSRILEQARLGEDDSYVGQTYSDDINHYAVDRLHEILRKRKYQTGAVPVSELELANPAPWGKETTLAEVVEALRTRTRA